jgi:hypothetical protein
MSYLFPEGSATEFGVVEVGSNIDVLNGVISIPQSVATTATPTFASLTATTSLTSPSITDSSLTAGRITFATTGGKLSDDGDLVYNPITNVLSLPNIEVSSSLKLNGASVVTSVTPSAGNGISLTSVTTSGPASTFTVNNTGVLSLTAGTGITISGSTGNITVSASGATVINTKGVSTNYTLLTTDDYVGATTGSITLTLPPGAVGQTFILKNEGGSGAVSVVPTAPDTIDGANSKSMNSNASITVVYRAGAWRII